MNGESDTFRSRLVRLVQKSRKALRLYTNVGKSQRGSIADSSEAQVREWREVNARLSRDLTGILEDANGRELSKRVFVLRDQLYHDWRAAQTNLHDGQRSLIRFAEKSDFIRAHSLSRDLVPLKARVQALQAAYHEVQQVLDQSQAAPPRERNPASSLSRSQDEAERTWSTRSTLSADDTVGASQESEEEKDDLFEEQHYRAKVIPLRRGDG